MAILRDGDGFTSRVFSTEKTPDIKIGYHILFRVNDGIATHYRDGYILDMLLDNDHMILKIGVGGASLSCYCWYDVQNISYFILSKSAPVSNSASEKAVDWVDK